MKKLYPINIRSEAGYTADPIIPIALLAVAIVITAVGLLSR